MVACRHVGMRERIPIFFHYRCVCVLWRRPEVVPPAGVYRAKPLLIAEVRLEYQFVRALLACWVQQFECAGRRTPRSFRPDTET